jgi:tetratricopeptide (TPR) repeat protein
MATKDLHGLPLATGSPETARAFNHAVEGYLGYRADAPLRLRQVLTADPEFAFGHLLKGYFSMLAFNLASVPAAREALETTRKLSAGVTRREQAHVAALAHWVAGDIDATLGAWEQILAEHPLDVLAFRLHHFLAFWYARPEQMAAQADATLAHWSPELTGWPALLACRCFAQEELGNYAVAEAAGREAIALAPGDLWAAHGVAHVMEMQGRHEEGISGLGTAAPLVRDYALPIGEAIIARAMGDPGRACDLMRPALAGMYRLGGSHAQQDVLLQLYLDCAVKARRTDDVKALLERLAARYSLPPAQRVGYADAVSSVN